MIHPSARWRFIQEISDKGYFEDEIVQHHLIEFRALRRSFSEKFCGDDAAVREALDQARLAARCNSPLMPIVYAAEKVQGRLCIIMELIRGRPVTELVGRSKFSRTRDWAAFTHRLLDNLLTARDAGARFERIVLEHFIISPTGEVRIVERSPVGLLTREKFESSHYLQRIAAQTGGGVYTSEELPDERGELDALREILVKVAAGNVKADIGKLREVVLKEPNMYPSPLAGIEKEVAEILLRMQLDGENGSPIHSLAELRDVVASLNKRAQSQRKTASTGAAPPLPYAQASEGASAPLKPLNLEASQSSGSSGARALYEMPVAPSGPVQTPPKDSPTGQRSSGQQQRGSGTGAEPVPKTPPPKPARKPAKAAGNVVDDDINPFASDEEVEDIKKEASKTPVKAPIKVSSSESKGSKQKIIVASLLAVAVIAIAAVTLPPLLVSSGPNAEPTAAVAPANPGPYTVNEPVPVDASPSTDPEASSLTYYWRVLSPSEEGSVIFTEVETERANTSRSFATKTPRIVLQFQGAGTYRIGLKVYDGAQYSEQVELSFRVVPHNS